MKEEKIKEEVIKDMRRMGLSGFSDFAVINKVINLTIQKAFKLKDEELKNKKKLFVDTFERAVELKKQIEELEEKNQVMKIRDLRAFDKIKELKVERDGLGKICREKEEALDLLYKENEDMRAEIKTILDSNQEQQKVIVIESKRGYNKALADVKKHNQNEATDKFLDMNKFLRKGDILIREIDFKKLKKGTRGK